MPGDHAPDESDLLPALIAVRDGTLATFDLRWRDDTAVGGGDGGEGLSRQARDRYRHPPARGRDQGGRRHRVPPATKRSESGAVTASGGRVLGVSALGKSVDQARDRVYRAVDAIDWPGGFCRRDIGWRAIGGRAPRLLPASSRRRNSTRPRRKKMMAPIRVKKS